MDASKSTAEGATAPVRPIIIGLAGGTASGKTTVCRAIERRLETSPGALEVIPMDAFYKPLTKQQQQLAHANQFNFDHPNALDFALMQEVFDKLQRGEPVDIPDYSFVEHQRIGIYKRIERPEIVLFEGIFGLFDEKLRACMDLKIFVDSDSDVRLGRRVRRDIQERGRDLDGVLSQYERYVKPAHDTYIQPTVRFADIVLPRGAANKVGIDLVTLHISMKLSERRLLQGKAAFDPLAAIKHVAVDPEESFSEW